MKSRYTKPSKTIKCQLCGLEMKARGLKSHLRFAHYLKIKEVTTVKGSEPDFTIQSVTKVKKSDPSEELIVTEKILVNTSYVSIKDMSFYQAIKRGEENARMTGNAIPSKDIRTLRAETEAWLNSTAGKKYMAEYEARQDSKLEEERAKNLANRKK